MTNLTVADLIHAGDFNAAVARMQRLVRLADPTDPVDVDAIRAKFHASRAHLRSMGVPDPVRVVVEVTR